MKKLFLGILAVALAGGGIGLSAEVSPALAQQKTASPCTTIKDKNNRATCVKKQRQLSTGLKSKPALSPAKSKAPVKTKK